MRTVRPVPIANRFTNTLDVPASIEILENIGVEFPLLSQATDQGSRIYATDIACDKRISKGNDCRQFRSAMSWFCSQLRYPRSGRVPAQPYDGKLVQRENICAHQRLTVTPWSSVLQLALVLKESHRSDLEAARAIRAVVRRTAGSRVTFIRADRLSSAPDDGPRRKTRFAPASQFWRSSEVPPKSVGREGLSSMATAYAVLAIAVACH